jgi:hypothetical protein
MKGRISKVEWSDPNNRRGIGRLLVAHCVNSLSRKIWSLSDNSGHRSILARDGSVAIDPTATSAAQCGKGLDAGF